MKRKDPPEAASAGENKRARPSIPVDDELEDEGRPSARFTRWRSQSRREVTHFAVGLSDRDRDPAELPSDDPKMDTDSMLAKRRHSRPLELDSEGEEEGDTSGKEESLSDGEEDTNRLLSDKVSIPRTVHQMMCIGFGCILIEFLSFALLF